MFAFRQLVSIYIYILTFENWCVAISARHWLLVVFVTSGGWQWPFILKDKSFVCSSFVFLFLV